MCKIPAAHIVFPPVFCIIISTWIYSLYPLSIGIKNNNNELVIFVFLINLFVSGIGFMFINLAPVARNEEGHLIIA